MQKAQQDISGLDPMCPDCLLRLRKRKAQLYGLGGSNEV